MGIQIPRLRQFEAQTPAVEPGRMDLNLPNPAELVEPLAKGGEAVIKTGVKFVENEVENAVNEYAARSTKSLYDEFNKGFETGYEPADTGLKYKTGPDAYEKGRVTFEERLNAKYQEILNDETVSSYVKSRAKAKLDKAMSSFDSQITTWAGKARNDYLNELDTSLIDTEVKTLITVKGPHFNPKDPATITGINDSLFAIEGIIREQARRNGHLLIDDNGKEKLSAAYEIKLNKTKSLALRDMIENIAYTPGQTEKAKVLYNTYSELIDGFGKEQTKKKIEQLSLEQRAADFGQTYVDLTYDEAQDALNKLKITDPIERKEFLKAYKQAVTDRDIVQDKNAKAIFTPVFQDVFNRMNSDEPYKTVAEAKQVHRKYWDTLRPKDLRMIEQMIERPTTSSPEAMDRAFGAYERNELIGLTAEEMTDLTAGLSNTHANMIRRSWMSANNPKTEMQKQEASKRMMINKYLNQELVAKKVIISGQPLTPKQEQERYRYMTNLMNELENLPPELIPDWYSSQAKELVRDVVERTHNGEVIERKKKEQAPAPVRRTIPTSGVKPNASPNTGAYVRSKASDEERRLRAEMISKKILTPGGPDDTFERIQLYKQTDR